MYLIQCRAPVTCAGRVKQLGSVNPRCENAAYTNG